MPTVPGSYRTELQDVTHVLGASGRVRGPETLAEVSVLRQSPEHRQPLVQGHVGVPGSREGSPGEPSGKAQQPLTEFLFYTLLWSPAELACTPSRPSCCPPMCTARF